MPYILADTEEAREHVREIEARGWPHSLTGCPPMCRAMCSHAVYVQDPSRCRKETDASKD